MASKPAQASRGRVRRELRFRVDALHRQRESVTPAGFSMEVDAQRDLHASVVDAPPLTLGFEIAQEFKRRRRRRTLDDKMLEQVRAGAIIEGKWAFGRDPNVRVCAAFAVEMAEHRSIRGLPFDSAPPDCVVTGDPYSSRFDVLQNTWIFRQADPDWPAPLTRKDRGQVRRLAVNWETVRAEGVAPALWKPSQRKSAFSSDVMRPPVEALALVKLVVEAPRSIALCAKMYPAVLLVGAGWCSAAQALSMLLPLHRVYHLPMPFADKAPPPTTTWDMVVINVPSAHHWMVARASARPGELPVRVQQGIVRGHLVNASDQHIKTIVEAAARHLQPGGRVALVSDGEVYGLALDELRSTKAIIPEQVHGIDTGKRPIWVGYDERPWAPHGFPNPSGRLVSFWRVGP